MKTLKYLFICICGLALTVCCSDESDYEPGPQADSDCMQVYFKNTNAAAVILTSDEDYVLNLEVGRVKTSEAASVPVVVESKDEVFNIPDRVEFAAGQSVAVLPVTFPNAQTAINYSFSISLDGSKYVDPYAILEGSSRFFGKLLIASWVVFAPNVKFTFQKDFDPFYHDILLLEGTDNYKIKNYLNTGYDLTFTIDATNSAVIPSGGRSTSTMWYCEGEDGSYYPFTGPGTTTIVTRFAFYLGASYTYMKLDTKTGRFYHYHYSAAGNGYNYVTFTW